MIEQDNKRPQPASPDAEPNRFVVAIAAISLLACPLILAKSVSLGDGR